MVSEPGNIETHWFIYFCNCFCKSALKTNFKQYSNESFNSFFSEHTADFDPGKSTRWLNIIRAKKNGMMKW